MVLVRVRTRGVDLSQVLATMLGVSLVEGIQGPYDLVVHVTEVDRVNVIEQCPGVIAAEACWLSPCAQGGADDDSYPRNESSDRRSASSETSNHGCSHRRPDVRIEWGFDGY
jgi:hypothetical protein